MESFISLYCLWFEYIKIRLSMFMIGKFWYSMPKHVNYRSNPAWNILKIRKLSWRFWSTVDILNSTAFGIVTHYFKDWKTFLLHGAVYEKKTVNKYPLGFGGNWDLLIAMLWPFGVACGERIHVDWLHFHHCIA